MRQWQAHHAIRVVCSFDMDVQASRNVGIGRDAGRASGARGGGSRKIWCWVDTLLCLYLWPRRWPMFCSGGGSISHCEPRKREEDSQIMGVFRGGTEGNVGKSS